MAEQEEVAAALPVAAMSVASVARRLGVAPSTLRTWDRRYGLGPRIHASGAHRRYAPDDVARLLVMRRLTLEGVSPAAAAQIAVAEPEPPVGHTAGHTVGHTVGHAAAERGRPRVLGLVPSEDVSAAVRGLTRAAMTLDVVEMTRLVRDALHSRGLEGMWSSLAVPALTRIGERWQATGEGVEVEHALTQVIVSVLLAERPVPARPVNLRPVLLACAEDEQHTLPLSVLEYALAEQAVSCRLLGTGMPRRAMVDAARRCGPAVVFLFARLDARDEVLLAELPRQRPPPTVVLGGPGWQECELPAGVSWVNTLGDAIDQVLDAVRV